ncbi:hypothetical protein IKE83_02175 [Candidatus Saccharibacteria bacterium]|nr:hypothetical protein [Candidatus Saccharibacteria bacterium]
MQGERVPTSKESENGRSSAQSIGSVALNAAYREGLVANSSKKFGEFTIENTRDYNRDLFEDNLHFLEDFVQDKCSVELYKKLMAEYPSLRCVELVDEDIDGNAWHTRFEKGHEKIFYNFSNRETYRLRNPNDFEKDFLEYDDRLGMKYSIKRLAFQVGADWKECAKNERLMADETLLHEFGHAYDFRTNFLKPQYDLLSGSHRGPEALHNASRVFLANRREYEAMSPDGAFGFIERHSEEWRKSEKRLRAMGIENYDEYLIARHQSYRDQPDEAFADKFALNYILRHFDDYFTYDEKERKDGKVLVDKDREIVLDQDFVHILNMKQGLGVKIKRLEEGRIAKEVSGFLAMNMYVGKNVYLYENGDPKNPGKKLRICQGISEIRLKPMRDEETGTVRHYVFFTDENGTDYHISRSGVEASFVQDTPQNMMDDLGLRKGDKIQAIRHQMGDARNLDKAKIGLSSRAFEGKFYDASGTNVVLDLNARILYAPPMRKWKTWYVGEYEILPLPK